MAIVEVNVTPLGTGRPNISSYIASCCDIIKKEEGIRYQVTPMSTVIEGDLDRVLEVVKKIHRVPFHNGVQRVLTSLTIDERTDREDSMEAMVQSVVT
ncbi:MAG: MTH1187 family thiamine-binding protein [Armatimonadetes bacterium]|nr:MTH1187 family thiamine-binding protein [Armatimonadota bacterium]